MKEAFVSALLIIVVDRKDSKKNDHIQDGDHNGLDGLVPWPQPETGIHCGGDEDLDDLILWRMIKQQIHILRKELDLEEG